MLTVMNYRKWIVDNFEYLMNGLNELSCSISKPFVVVGFCFEFPSMHLKYLKLQKPLECYAIHAKHIHTISCGFAFVGSMQFVVAIYI